jgi:phosphinothricin acetyltransferase
VIRAATAGDAARVAALWNHYIRDTLVTFNRTEKPEAEVAQLIAAHRAAGHGFLVATEGGGLAGFATYTQFRAGVGYAHTMEHTILLDPAARGRGVGRALLAAMEDHARLGGARSILAGVSGANTEGRAFHLAMGYAEVAVLREVGRKWDRWLDLHLMQKTL